MTIPITLPQPKRIPQYRAEWLATGELGSALLKCDNHTAELFVNNGTSNMSSPIPLTAHQLRDLAEVATSGAELLEGNE